MLTIATDGEHSIIANKQPSKSFAKFFGMYAPLANPKEIIPMKHDIDKAMFRNLINESFEFDAQKHNKTNRFWIVFRTSILIILIISILAFGECEWFGKSIATDFDRFVTSFL